MADEQDNTSPEEQALADEWAAALAEAGDASQDDIDALLNQAPAAAAPAAPLAPLEDFASAPKSTGVPLGLEGPNLDVILDIPVSISMEVGSTEISIRNLLQLNQGSVVELDRLAGEPLDVLVNGTLIAHGEVVVVNEKFGIRLTDVISPTERIKKLR
jgi:flagellar motor switch protein FliN/FliY